jgi:hypothetical protein
MFEIVLLRSQGVFVNKRIQAGEIGDSAGVQFSILYIWWGYKKKNERIISISKFSRKLNLYRVSRTGKHSRTVVIRIIRAQTFSGELSENFHSAPLYNTEQTRHIEWKMNCAFPLLNIS